MLSQQSAAQGKCQDVHWTHAREVVESKTDLTLLHAIHSSAKFHFSFDFFLGLLRVLVMQRKIFLTFLFVERLDDVYFRQRVCAVPLA